MNYIIEQNFNISYHYKIFFTEDLFDINNKIFVNVFRNSNVESPCVKKLVIIIDDGVIKYNVDFVNKVVNYCNYYNEFLLLKSPPFILCGGENIKNDFKINNYIYNIINENCICRHSFVVAIGGGSLLDSVGFSVATAHRGVRLIRIPTTVLSQNDSGVGVKNSINYFEKKNFLGTFAPPYCVINDINFLFSLSDRDWLSGISEAIKVGLIKDRNFFYFIKDNVKNLVDRNIVVMQKLIYHCAKLHIDHISGLDPFEFGSSRPLDFGHWAAHKLEILTKGRLNHGEAVAIGICLDSAYSYFSGFLEEKFLKEIIGVFLQLKFNIYVKELNYDLEKNSALFLGLQEFQEHLGGKLTVMMLKNIGEGFNVNNIDIGLLIKSIDFLKFNC